MMLVSLKRLYCLLVVSCFFLHSFPVLAADSAHLFPVAYKGRYRPAEAYAFLYLRDLDQTKMPAIGDGQTLFSSSPTALTLLWKLHFLGYPAYASSPLEQAFQERVAQLQKEAVPPAQMAALLENEYPLMQRLRTAGSLFKSLPSRLQEEWLPLKALTIQTYDPISRTLKPVGNFTLFSDAHFFALRDLYGEIERETTLFPSSPPSQDRLNQLASSLTQAYLPLSGKVSRRAHEKSLTYPTLGQLQAEVFYFHYPWMRLLILFYTLATSLWIVFITSKRPWTRSVAMTLTTVAFLSHTTLLVLRIYILDRPPVSSMVETALYVPWIAVCLSLLWPAFRRHPFVPLAACLASITLLLILEIANVSSHLDQVQAVLDSQFWLTTHVLLIVGSYGVFLLGALLGHAYLGLFIIHRRETSLMKRLTPLILQTLYGGTALLIVGTILGGVWAAESWGRFWDWDPKESWAFFSICLYLIWIHAYRFAHIASFGLAIAAVSGWLAISFTWYGVNYILGTGLHSYGFGAGGEYGYYAFLGTDLIFVTTACSLRTKSA